MPEFTNKLTCRLTV